MNFNLTEEQKAIRETVRKFAQAEVAPRAEELDRTGEFPYDLVKRCAEVGIQGLLFPEELGGTNADVLSWVLAIEELARGDASLAVTIFVGAGAGAVIQQRGTPEMIRDWVLPIIIGEGIGSFAITEPDAGSDNRSIRTTAEIRGDRIVVNGVKSFITNPGTKISKFINTVCALKSDVDNPRDRPFCIVSIPTGTTGYTVSEKYRKMGWRSSDTRECRFDDCVVPLNHMISQPGKGLEEGWGVLNLGRISLAATSVGLAQASLDASLKFARQRVQFGRPIGSFQRVQDMVVEMAVEIEAARLLTLQAAFLWEQDHDVQKEISMAKLYATEAAKKVADLGVQVHGGFGFMDEYAVSRYYRDVRIHTIGDGTSQIQRMIIARTLGLRV
ncbi:MAG: acyl-CoA dehydrogenase family protein [Proteobacteria bacterium]|nr:acyl-CoA dehydrogenase family protein [Pseudomonadota bacterium]